MAQILEQPKTGLGSVEETNRLLQEASKQTGLAAPTFSPTGAITTDTLAGGEKPLTVPEIPTSTVAAGLSAFATSVGEQEKERAKIQAEQETKALEAQAGVTEERGKLQSLMDRILGTQASRATLEEEAQIGEKAQRVTTYTNQLESLERAEVNEMRALQGAGLTDVQRAARGREISRKYAFEKADVALLQSAANRDLETAQNIINRKIELTLEPLLTQLDFTKFFYQENKADFTKAEDRAFNLKISELDRQYTETKSLEKYKADVVLNALQNGIQIPSYVLGELNRATTQEEVAQVLARNGVSLQDPLQRQISEANLANIYSQIAERNATAAGMDVVNLLAYAQQYAATGQIPTGLPKGTFGVVAQTAKELPKPAGAVVDRNTGIKSSATGDALQGAFGTMYSVVELAKELKELDKKRVSGIIGGTFGKIFGATDQQRYLDLREQISDLLARARTGAAINTTEEKRYFDLLPSRFSEPFFLGADSQVRIDNFISTVTKDIDNKTRTQGLAVYGLSTVDIGGQKYKIGDIVSNEAGQVGRVNPDGSITIIEQ